MRQDYQQFVDRGAEILVVGPDSEMALKEFWQRENLPYVGLADPTHTVAGLYGQQVRLLKLGRLPALMVIDQAGHVRHSHYGGSASDIPPSREILSVLDDLNQERATRS